MLPIQLNVPASFLEEEVRIDYTVSAAMKKVWAVQLDLLAQLKRICEKHHLTYFADSGTLMGAIRHQGFIPWDDDIDIVMMREDYDKLIKVGNAELAAPYFLQSAHSETFPRGYARLRNSDTTALTRNDLGKNINHGIFIDIFPLDHVPDDLTERRTWLKEINKQYKVIQYGVLKPLKKMTTLPGKLRVLWDILVVKCVGYDKLIDRYETLCRKYNGVPTKELSYVAYSRGKQKHIWLTESFASCHEVPFEFTTINIPDGYDDRLTREYKDYMKVVRAASSHGETVLEAEIPYKEYLKQHSREQRLIELNEE